MFQLLLALSQKSSDELHILDLVDGDKPLLPLVWFQLLFPFSVLMYTKLRIHIRRLRWKICMAANRCFLNGSFILVISFLLIS